MAEWLKNICMSPFKYGLNKINYIAVNAISVILNLCGKRLLKMENDKIIKNNECKDEKDIFYLYPLQLQQMEQNIGPNLVKIENGIINNLIISIPWKAMFSEPTVINIPSIKLVITLTQNLNSIYFSSLENTNSYFLSSNHKLKENQDLINAYQEIKSLLTQYFNKINLEIVVIEIVISDHFKIIFNDLSYNNNMVNIGKISGHVIDKEEIKLFELKKIIYVAEPLGEDLRLSIEEVFVDPNFVKYLPNFYVDDSESDLSINITIDLLRMEKIRGKYLDIHIKNGCVIIKKISSISIENILLFNEDNISENNLIIFDPKNNMILFGKSINIKFSSIGDIVQWIEYIKGPIKCATDKIIVVKINDSQTKNFLQIHNLIANVIYGDDIFGISLHEINTKEIIKLTNVKITYDDTNTIINEIYFGPEDYIMLANSNIKSKKFHIFSTLTKISKKENGMNISFDQANAINIMDIVNFVTVMVDKFTPKEKPAVGIPGDLEKENKPYMVNLQISKSSICEEYIKTYFYFNLENADICINTKEAKDIVADILMNEYLLATLQSKYISSKLIEIDKLRFYIDPEIFDQINYLCGTLTPESEPESEDPIVEISSEGLKQLHEALARSMVSHNVADLENSIKKTTHNIIENYKKSVSNAPQINILNSSFANLRTALIDDYFIDKNEPEGLQFKITINSFHCYFFNKLLQHTSQNQNDPAFLCVIMKNIIFKKIIEQYKENNNKPLISILESRKLSKPKTMDKYSLYIKCGSVIDTQCRDPEWKYFIKFSRENMLDANVMIHGDALRVSIKTGSITANIREETLIRLLAFFSNSHHIPKTSSPIYIEHFNISDIIIILNYYPLILKQIGMGPNSFTLKDFKLHLSSQIVSHVNGFDKLLNIIGDKWKEDINPDNILQFVPNIKIIQPYAVPIVNFFRLTTKYFKHSHNKIKIRTITKNINMNVDMVSSLVKHGVSQVWELFN
jgi:hypothetical protein